MLQPYIASISATLQSMNGAIDASIGDLLGTIAVWSVIFYVPAAVVILIGKLAKKIRVVNDVGTKMISSGCGLFLFYGLLSLYLMRGQFAQLLYIFHPKVFSALLQKPGQLVFILLIYAVLIVLLLFLLGLLLFCLGVCKKMFVNNRKANGPAIGLFLSLYELLSGIAWLGAVLAAFSISIAIALVVLVFAASAGIRTRYYYDGHRYYYKEFY